MQLKSLVELPESILATFIRFINSINQDLVIVNRKSLKSLKDIYEDENIYPRDSQPPKKPSDESGTQALKSEINALKGQITSLSNQLTQAVARRQTTESENIRLSEINSDLIVALEDLLDGAHDNDNEGNFIHFERSEERRIFNLIEDTLTMLEGAMHANEDQVFNEIRNNLVRILNSPLRKCKKADENSGSDSDSYSYDSSSYGSSSESDSSTSNDDSDDNDDNNDSDDHDIKKNFEDLQNKDLKQDVMDRLNSNSPEFTCDDEIIEHGVITTVANLIETIRNGDERKLSSILSDEKKRGLSIEITEEISKRILDLSLTTRVLFGTMIPGTCIIFNQHLLFRCIIRPSIDRLALRNIKDIGREKRKYRAFNFVMNKGNSKEKAKWESDIDEAFRSDES